MFKTLLNNLVVASCLFCSTSFAGFPDDFSDVTWLDPNISAWSENSTLTVSVNLPKINFAHSKRGSWPNTNHSVVGRCCNASVWTFIKRNGRWYAVTFEYLRPNQIQKGAAAFAGGNIKRAPFLAGGFNWKPANGEVYGFMVSGFARFNLNDVNIRERSNIAFYKWGAGPTNANEAKNFTEVARNPDGTPGTTVIPPEPDPEECIAPTVPPSEVKTHLYSGTATGTVVVSGPVNQTLNYSEPVSLTVSDNRSLVFNIDDEGFNSSVAQDGTFAGTFTFDILGQCLVNITVNGLINGTSATGTSNGSESCIINGSSFSAVFNASFNATSATAPSYVDERPPATPPAKSCNSGAVVPPIMLLLDE